MYIGHLSEIMSLDEDSKSALKSRRVANRKLTGMDFQYDGSKEDYLKQIKRRSNKKQYNQVVKDIKNAGWTDGSPASLEPGSRLIGVNKQMGKDLGLINKDGTTNRNSRIYTHEKQHDNQFQVLRDIAGHGRNSKKRYEKLNDRLMQSYKLDDLKSSDPKKQKEAMDNYSKHPLEYDANAAAKRGYTSKGAGTERAVNAAIGRGRGFKTTVNHGQQMNAEALPDGMRQAQKAALRQQAQIEKQQNAQNQKRVVSDDQVPDWIKNKVNSQQQTVKAQQPNMQVGTVKQVVQPQPQVVQQQPIQQVQQPKINANNSATDSRTGITYAKVNGKLVSNAMQQRPIQQPQQQLVQQPVQQQVVRPQPQVVQQPVQQVQPQQQVVQQQPVQQVAQPQKVIIRPAVNQVVKRVKPQTIVNQ